MRERGTERVIYLLITNVARSASRAYPASFFRIPGNRLGIAAEESSIREPVGRVNHTALVCFQAWGSVHDVLLSDTEIASTPLFLSYRALTPLDGLILWL